MGLRRGFKSEANAYARVFRRELDLEANAPLCPFRLAEHLGVVIVPLQQFANDQPEAYDYLKSDAGQNEFSALTICYRMERLIIYNNAHSPGRIAADVAHELSHIILLHPSKPPLDEKGSRHYDAELEAEAEWLGPALLVSEEAAMTVARNGLTDKSAATLYGVSQPLMRMRLNVVGARKRARR